MLEKQIEQKLVRLVRDHGGLCLKFLSSTDGWPDRLILMPGGRVLFAELKAPGKKPRPLQLCRHAQLRARGFDVAILDTPASVQRLMKRLIVELEDSDEVHTP